MLALVAVALVLVTPPAWSQARDPFRPPAGAGATTSGGAAPGTGGTGQAVSPPATGGLPRTGQDLLDPLAVAAALIAMGGALLLTGRLVAV
jgi:hypothetical protein